MVKKDIIQVILVLNKTTDNIKSVINSITNQTYNNFQLTICSDEKLDINASNIEIKKSRDINKVVNKNCKYFMILDENKILNKTLLETLYFALERNVEADYAYSDVEVVKGNFKKYYNLKFNYNFDVKTHTKLIVPLIRNNNITDYNNLDFLKLKSIHLSYYGVISFKDVKTENVSLKTSLQIDFPRECYNWERFSDIGDIIMPIKEKDNKKNILMIIPWMVMGGADLFNLDFLRLINKDKYRITIISCQPTEYLWREKFEEYAEEVFDLSSFLDRKDYIHFICYLIESRNIDLIFNTNSTLGYASIPYIKVNYPTIPILDYIHMEEWYNRNGGYSRDSWAVNNFIDKTLFCNNNSAKIYNEYFKISKEKISTLYIGVDEKKFNRKNYDEKKIKEKYGINKNSINIGYICRIASQKRPFLLVEIIKKVVDKRHDINFLIAGDGPLLFEMKKKVLDEGLEEYVKFLGKIEQPVEFYMLCDMTLNCSIKEGLALTSYESLSMNLPVISSDVGGQGELINEKVGVTIPLIQDEKEIENINYSDKEIKMYVDAIDKVIKDLDNYKKSARDRILDGFTLDNMIQNMEREIDELTKKPNKKIIEKSKSLKDYQNMLEEHYSYYLLASMFHSEYLVNNYNSIHYKKIEEPVYVEDKKVTFLKKIHLYREYLLLFDFLKSILKVILFPARLIILEIKKIKNKVVKTK